MSDKYIHNLPIPKSTSCLKQELDRVDYLLYLAELSEDPVKEAILSGLYQIQEDIGEQDLNEYLQQQKDKARKRIFDKT